MIYLHIWNASAMPSRGIGYMENIVGCFGRDNHWLYLVSCEGVSEDIPLDIIVYKDDITEGKEARKQYFIKILQQVDYVIVHGIRDDILWQINLLSKFQNRKKTAWVIWGQEVHDQYQQVHRIAWKHLINYMNKLRLENTKKRFIKDVTAIIGEQQDCELATQYYINHAKMVPYNFGGYAYLKIPVFGKKENRGFSVLVGHNAYSQCRHIDTFKLLKKFDDKKMKVICPLPFEGGMPTFVSMVSRYGLTLFGERFIPIYNRQSYSEYCHMLFDVDVAIFNHTRQMAQGNVEKLIYYGKKIYFSCENTNYEVYSSIGAYVYRIEEITKDGLYMPLSDEEKTLNKAIIEKELSLERFKSIWLEVFEA